MNQDKMSSSEVPGKFVEWALSMGCPPEKIPSMDKVEQMCRGQYYKVWRSLIERVESKDVIRQKRLQVLYDDVRRCQQVRSPDGGVLVSREVQAWRERQAARAQVLEAEERVAKLRAKLTTNMDKVSGKMAKRQVVSRRVADTERRVRLLQTLAEEQTLKKQRLVECKDNAEGLCRRPGEADSVKPKLDRCLTALQRQNVSPTTRPVASSAHASTNVETVDNCEEYLAAVADCPADELWRELRTRRAALVDDLSAANSPRPANNDLTPQCMVASTAALHCQLSLEAMKNKLQAKQTRDQLANTLDNMNDIVNPDSGELLVVRCEQACASARAATYRRLLADVTSRSGAFAPAQGEPPAEGRGAVARAQHLHGAMLSKKEDTKKLLSTLSITERKIETVRDRLGVIFNGFQKDLDECQPYRGGIQLDLPSDTVMSVRRLYRDLPKRRGADQSFLLDDSMDDESESSSEWTSIDELRFFLKKFSLEKNRKLVLESGEKVWISETLQASAARLRARCLADDVTCALACLSLGPVRTLQRLCDVTRHRSYLERLAVALDAKADLGPVIDITHMRAEEDQQTDKIKKSLNANILCLQKTAKTLDLGQENLALWSQNVLRLHISSNRTVDGKTYKDYETLYLLKSTDV